MNTDAAPVTTPFDADAALAADPDFAAICDDRRVAAIEAQDSDPDAGLDAAFATLPELTAAEIDALCDAMADDPELRAGGCGGADFLGRVS